MQDNTISDIMTAHEANLPTGGEKFSKFEDKIIGMYDNTVSEEMYDTDEICTKICEDYFNELDDCPDDVLACRLIYDIFYTCKKHVAMINFEHDLRIAHELEGHRIKDRMSGYIKTNG